MGHQVRISIVIEYYELKIIHIGRMHIGRMHIGHISNVYSIFADTLRFQKADTHLCLQLTLDLAQVAQELAQQPLDPAHHPLDLAHKPLDLAYNIIGTMAIHN